jgi:hypothetical protein
MLEYAYLQWELCALSLPALYKAGGFMQARCPNQKERMKKWKPGFM